MVLLRNAKGKFLL